MRVKYRFCVTLFAATLLLGCSATTEADDGRDVSGATNTDSAGSSSGLDETSSDSDTESGVAESASGEDTGAAETGGRECAAQGAVAPPVGLGGESTDWWPTDVPIFSTCTLAAIFADGLTLDCAEDSLRETYSIDLVGSPRELLLSGQQYRLAHRAIAPFAQGYYYVLREHDGGLPIIAGVGYYNAPQPIGDIGAPEGYSAEGWYGIVSSLDFAMQGCARGADSFVPGGVEIGTEEGLFVVLSDTSFQFAYQGVSYRLDVAEAGAFDPDCADGLCARVVFTLIRV